MGGGSITSGQENELFRLAQRMDGMKSVREREASWAWMERQARRVG